MRFLLPAALAAYANTLVSAATSEDWRSRSIYQVITDRFAREDGSTTATCNTGDRLYCGGNYRGLIKKLDYIQNMGFSAVWISPVVKNFEGKSGYGEAYHGYWQQDLYGLNPHFGEGNQLKELSKALHDRGMYLMVDVVVNHNGWPGSPDTIDHSKFNPFNDAKYYHPYCEISNYDDEKLVEDCWLGDKKVELADLKTEDPTVASMYNDWIKQLVSNYSIDGLRLDTAKHVNKDFLPGFNKAAGVFMTGEVFSGDPSSSCDYQNYMDSILNFPIYYPLTRAFASPDGKISDLVDMVNKLKGSSPCKDATFFGTFSENHDLPRFPAMTPDLSSAKNVMAYTLLGDGIPILYQGQEQHFNGSGDPDNREALWLSGYNTDHPLYQLVAKTNALRNLAIKKDSGYVTYRNWIIHSDTNTLAMRKGFDGKQIIAVLSNKGENGDTYNLSLDKTGFAKNSKVVEVLTCKTETVDGKGNLNVPMEKGLPKVYFPADQLKGSKICNY